VSSTRANKAFLRPITTRVQHAAYARADPRAACGLRSGRPLRNAEPTSGDADPPPRATGTEQAVTAAAIESVSLQSVRLPQSRRRRARGRSRRVERAEEHLY
jgi:hypothetical protein